MDSDRISELNDNLLAELKRRGTLTSPQVEDAFRAVPRHQFLPGLPLEEVYSDRAIMTKQVEGAWVSSSSQPSIMAIMLEQLALEPGHLVLEIGAGTGYNAALIAHLVGPRGQVITVDIAEDVVAGASQNLAGTGFVRVQVICADGGYGYAAAAPYDRIILTVGAADIAPAWWEQLKPGGRLVLPLEVGVGQKSIAFVRAEGGLASQSLSDCGFMPIQGAFAGRSVKRVFLGPQPGLFLQDLREPLPEADSAYAWLQQPGHDRETGVWITLPEFLRSLRLWVALHEPGFCSLVATSDQVDQNLVPPLVALGGEWKSANTGVLLGERGMAALARPPGQTPPLADINRLLDEDHPFELFVRPFGLGEEPAGRLVQAIQDWDRNGRPGTSGLQLHAYQQGSPYQPSAGEFVIENQWTRLILHWPGTKETS